MDILFENDELLVINKPAGLVMHPDGKAQFETLTDIILREYPELHDIGEPLMIGNTTILRPGIVHRLDKDTSGCLLIAKTQASFQNLKSQFQNHTIVKTYHACVYGNIKEKTGTIDVPIGRAKTDIRKWATGRGARGELRDAVTEFIILGRIGTEEEKGSTLPGTYAYVALYPKTGRTHQIRVHLKHINHPIISDELYAPGREHALGFERLALHAHQISFTTLSGEQMTVLAPFPSDFIYARGLFDLDPLGEF